MKKMVDYFQVNAGWILLTILGLVIAVCAITKFQKPTEIIPITVSKDFSNDPVVGTPVMRNNPYADLFRDAARATIGEDKVNPWTYLGNHLDRVKKGSGTPGVSNALIDFITKDAGRKIPDSSDVSLSIRDYSNPNSIVMEYRDPAKDSIMVTTGHDPEPALYATFANKTESKTFKLICTNGLVEDLGGNIINFNEDYIIKEGDNFIDVTGATPVEAYGFSLRNKLPVRVVLENGRVHSSTHEFPRKRVFANYRKLATKNGAKFDVVLQPGDVLRKQNNIWLYITK